MSLFLYRTCVLERRHLIGGASVTEEIVPGFKFSRASYVLSLLRPQIFKDLELKKHGLKVKERKYFAKYSCTYLVVLWDIFSKSRAVMYLKGRERKHYFAHFWYNFHVKISSKGVDRTASWSFQRWNAKILQILINICEKVRKKCFCNSRARTTALLQVAELLVRPQWIRSQLKPKSAKFSNHRFSLIISLCELE